MRCVDARARARNAPRFSGFAAQMAIANERGLQWSSTQSARRVATSAGEPEQKTAGGGSAGGGGSDAYNEAEGDDSVLETDHMTGARVPAPQARLSTVKGHLRRMHGVLNAVLKTQFLLGGSMEIVSSTSACMVQDVLRDVAQVRALCC